MLGPNAEQGHSRPKAALSPPPPQLPHPHITCAATSCLVQSTCLATEPHSCPCTAQAPRGWRGRDSRPGDGWRLGAVARDTSAAPGAWHSVIPAGRGSALPHSPALALTQTPATPGSCTCSRTGPRKCGRGSDRQLPSPHQAAERRGELPAWLLPLTSGLSAPQLLLWPNVCVPPGSCAAINPQRDGVGRWGPGT